MGTCRPTPLISIRSLAKEPRQTRFLATCALRLSFRRLYASKALAMRHIGLHSCIRCCSFTQGCRHVSGHSQAAQCPLHSVLEKPIPDQSVVAGPCHDGMSQTCRGLKPFPSQKVDVQNRSILQYQTVHSWLDRHMGMRDGLCGAQCAVLHVSPLPSRLRSFSHASRRRSSAMSPLHSRILRRPSLGSAANAARAMHFPQLETVSIASRAACDNPNAR